MSRLVPAVLALFIIAIGGTYGLEAALETAGPDTTVTNETFTPTAGSVTTLDDSNIADAYYNHNVTVYDEADATDGRQEMDAGDDYRWFVGNGTVKPLTGGELDGDANATITYGYALPTQRHEGMTALVSNIPTVLGIIGPLFAFLIFVRVVAG